MNGVVIVIAFCFVLIIFEIVYANFVIDKEMQSMDTYLVNSLDAIDDKLKNMGRLSLFSFSNAQVQEILHHYEQYDYREKLQSQRVLDAFYTSLISIREDMDGIYIFDNEDLIYWRDFVASTHDRTYPISEYMDELARMEQQKGKVSGCHLKIGGRLPFMNYLMDYSMGKYFYLSRSINSFSPFERIGYIVISAKEEVFTELLRRNLEPAAYFYLFSPEDELVEYQEGEGPNADEDALVRTLRDGMRGTSGNFWRRMGKEPYLFSYLKSNYSGLTLAIGKSASATFAVLLRTAAYSLLFLAATIAVTLLIIFRCTKRRLQPLRELSQVMSSFQLDHNDFRFQTDAQDEVGTCMQSFNEMQDTIGRLLEEKYKSKEKLHEAQMRQQRTSLLYLKNQVNPHFLYNTLDTIRIRAQLNGDKETAYMILQLVRFFRLNVKADQQFVTIAHEVELLTAYMKLMSYRYDKLEFQVCVEEGLEGIQIPNFMLQPLVENGLMHGLRDLGYRGRIQVKVQRDAEKPEYIHIFVCDNGIGLKPNQREMLDCMLKSYDSDSWREQEETHIGVLNVQKRLKMYYPKECGLSFHENPEGGVTVEILILEEIQEQ